jgi:general secretion pathway protein G
MPQVSPLRPGRAAEAPQPDPCSLIPDPCSSGFTLIELIIVMTIMLVLMGMAIPLYLRKAIDSYTVDKSRAPQSLQDLVESGYLKSMPKDPITARTDTWTTTQSDNLNSIDQTQPGIDDVHSGAQQVSLEGTSYNTW